MPTPRPFALPLAARRRRRALALGLSLSLGLAVAGCERGGLVASTTCAADAECPAGQLCTDAVCVPAGTVACQGTGQAAPLLQPSPRVVDFGLVASQAALVQTVTLRNLGTCTLTLFGADLADAAQGFTCSLCTARFPLELFPGRSLDLDVGFQASAPAAASTELTLRSDDPQYPALAVPMRADYQGTPRPLAVPASLDFGYVAQGRLAALPLQLSNLGTGSAPAVVKGAVLSPPSGTDFSLGPLPALPQALVPFAQDRTASLALEVRFTPRTAAAQSAELLVTTSAGVVRVPLAGTAALPASLTLSATDLDLGDVTLGATAVRTLTLVNQGGVPLIAGVHWASGTTTDLATAPAVVPAVPPGGLLELQVALTATRTGAYSGLLQVDTNDPRHPSQVVTVHGAGVAGPGPAVVKIDVTSNPGASGVLTDDVRKVGATLENPWGLTCNKAAPSPQTWGDTGSCTYVSFGPQENPERFVLTDARQDGTWRVLLTYTRDCASLPTALVVSLLGISADALQLWLTEGTVVVPGQDIGQLVENLCLSHQPSSVDVRVFVNGTQVAEKTATIATQGESAYALELVRDAGAFTAH
jgi:Flagellar-associated PapD-like